MATWILVLGDIGIPECIEEIPKPFFDLISNLKTNQSNKKIVCTGNIGSSEVLLKQFFLDLVDNIEENLITVEGLLSSSLHRVNALSTGAQTLVTTTLDVSGVSIGICNGYQLNIAKDSVGKPYRLMSDPEYIFQKPVHIIIHSHREGPSVQRYSQKDGTLIDEDGNQAISPNEGVILLNPGSLTGCATNNPNGKALPSFMLLSIDNGKVSVYVYSLTPDLKEAFASQIDLQAPIITSARAAA